LRHFAPILISAALIALGGSQAQAAQPPASWSGSFLRADDYRVASVGYRLAIQGRPQCRTLLPVTGLFIHYLAEYDPANRAEAAALYGVDRGPGVLSVVADSPAARAGLVAGDVLLSANNVPLPDGEAIVRAGAGKAWRKATAQMESQLEDQLRLGPVRLRVLRAGRELDVVLDSAMGCPIRTRLARSRQANAFADGRTAIITTRLLAFVANENELAVALAHEAAHNILGHPAQLEEEKVPKGFLGHFGGNAKRVRATEEEADRLALKLLWSAGYAPAAAIPFWRRLYRTFDPIPTPKFFSRHPSLAARERIVEETLAELGKNSPKPQP
jgi:hypothetical protein